MRYILSLLNQNMLPHSSFIFLNTKKAPTAILAMSAAAPGDRV
jgi:hypothetical protein